MRLWRFLAPYEHPFFSRRLFLLGPPGLLLPLAAQLFFTPLAGFLFLAVLPIGVAHGYHLLREALYFPQGIPVSPKTKPRRSPWPDTNTIGSFRGRSCSHRDSYAEKLNHEIGGILCRSLYSSAEIDLRKDFLQGEEISRNGGYQ
jgi:hypothetical protein